MNDNVKIVLALGSNHNAEQNIATGIHGLKKLFKDIQFSSQLWTEPIGIKSDRFLNCVGVGNTRHGYDQIHRALRHLERSVGTCKAEKSKGIVRLDIDILQLGTLRYHEDDWQRTYIRTLTFSMRSLL